MHCRVYSLRLLVCCTTAFAAADSGGSTSSIKPLSIPPSLYWDGDAGLWSSFEIQVGTPGQVVRLLPGTSATSATCIWVVIPIGCDEINPTLAKCAQDRGWLFASNASTTWSTQHLMNGAYGATYSLNLFEENLLGIAADASFGYDTVELGVPGSGLPTVNNQLIAGIWTNDFFLGSLGLSPIPTNFTSFDDPQISLLSSLRNQSLIPSISWGYTAGAYFRNVFGSLTLGGFDRSRFQPNNMTFSFGPDISRDLVVGLRSITYDTAGASPLSAQSIDIFIDSLVADLWLPVNVCEAFATQFNLTWNEQGQLYVVTDAAYAALSKQNPEFSFAIGQASTGPQSSETLEIRIPYSAFDLNLTNPIVNGSARYFPLRRALNSTQYTLGRAFLQEAYVVADYDRHNFSVSQALFPPTSENQDIVAIYAPGSRDDGGASPAKDSLSRGAIAGIVIGAVVGIATIIAIVVFLLRRRSRKRCKGQSPVNNDTVVSEEKKMAFPLDTLPSDDHHIIHEADDTGRPRHEMEAPFKQDLFTFHPDSPKSPETSSPVSPSIASPVSPEMSIPRSPELASPEIPAHEMPARESAAYELEASVK